MDNDLYSFTTASDSISPNNQVSRAEVERLAELA
jgi:hypothetical protein